MYSLHSPSLLGPFLIYLVLGQVLLDQIWVPNVKSLLRE